jgi:hypothetical protein
MKRRLLFSAAWIAAVFILMIMTFTLSFASHGDGLSSTSLKRKPSVMSSATPMEGKVRKLLQKELNQNMYPPYNSPANPWLHLRKEPATGKRFVKQTWTSIDGKKYRPLNTGTQRYLFSKTAILSK